MNDKEKIEKALDMIDVLINQRMLLYIHRTRASYIDKQTENLITDLEEIKIFLKS